MTAATTYRAGIAPHLAWAQAVLDTHITSSATGRCLTCEQPGPCPLREAATVVFFGSASLPRRRPGATRPQLVGARRVA